MKNSRQSRRLHTFSILTAIAAAAGTLFVGGIPSVQALDTSPASSEDEVSAQAVYHTYTIRNWSDATLTMKDTYPRQPQNHGWGIEPPKTIGPWQEAEFEVKFWWAYGDNSTLVYETSEGDEVTIKADAENATNDSFCFTRNEETSCETEKFYGLFASGARFTYFGLINPHT